MSQADNDSHQCPQAVLPYTDMALNNKKCNLPPGKSNLNFHEILVKHQTIVTIFSERHLCIRNTRCGQPQGQTQKAVVGKFGEKGRLKLQ